MSELPPNIEHRENPLARKLEETIGLLVGSILMDKEMPMGQIWSQISFDRQRLDNKGRYITEHLSIESGRTPGEPQQDDGYRVDYTQAIDSLDAPGTDFSMSARVKDGRMSFKASNPDNILAKPACLMVILGELNKYDEMNILHTFPVRSLQLQSEL